MAKDIELTFTVKVSAYHTGGREATREWIAKEILLHLQSVVREGEMIHADGGSLYEFGTWEVTLDD